MTDVEEALDAVRAGCPLPIDAETLADEVERLRAAVRRAGEEHLHSEFSEYCITCTDEPFPCPTVRALDGEA